jgi:hypothetical protein
MIFQWVRMFQSLNSFRQWFTIYKLFILWIAYFQQFLVCYFLPWRAFLNRESPEKTPDHHSLIHHPHSAGKHWHRCCNKTQNLVTCLGNYWIVCVCVCVCVCTCVCIYVIEQFEHIFSTSQFLQPFAMISDYRFGSVPFPNNREEDASLATQYSDNTLVSTWASLTLIIHFLEMLKNFNIYIYIYIYIYIIFFRNIFSEGNKESDSIFGNTHSICPNGILKIN